jgi:2'-5' RNA ligase
MDPTESAVIVAVPEAGDVVGPHRAELDRAASWGVPAHVTVLYPFVPPAKIDDRVIRALADALQSVTAFGITFARVAWFGDEVVWLAPEPHHRSGTSLALSRPVSRITRRTAERIPS